MSRSSSSRVLRLAVIVDDLVCDELHQTAPASVTVGSAIANDLVLYGARVPGRHRLFDYRGGRYFLDLPPQARGKVALGGKTVTVSALRRKLGAGENLRLQLPAKAKGKLRLGETVVLFQFARPKPVPKRPPFPVEFKPRLDQLVSREDAASLASAALVLGSYFTWAANAEVDTTIDPEDLDERFVQVMGIQRDEEELSPEEEEDETLAQEDEEKEKEKEREPEPEPEKKLEKKPEKFSEKAVKKARGVGVARVLGTYSDDAEGSVIDVIQETENNLGEMFDEGMATTVLADGGDISPFVPGGEGIEAEGAMAKNEGLETGEGPEVEKKPKKRERKIKSNLKTRSADVFGDVDKKAVNATIRRRIGALRYCYEKALRTQPDLGGKITYTIAISVMGSVTRVSVEQDTVGSSAVRACTTAKIRGWRFPMQGAEEPADVTFPVVFSGGG